MSTSPADRKVYERALWGRWVEKYEEARKEGQREGRSPRYVLLNYIARQLKEDVKELEGRERVELLNRVLEVFANPYEYNEWFETNYWRKEAQPIKLTCSS